MGTMTYTGQLVIETCWCGIAHAIPKDLSRQAVDTGMAVFCPLGHQWVVRKNRADEERERRESAEAQASHLRDQLQASERSKAALKGVVTRTKRRVGKGVCPCCNRHFANVERHMATQHAGYDQS